MTDQKQSGLEVIQAFMQGESSAIQLAPTVILKPQSVGFGQVSFETIVDEPHISPMGSVYGSFAATVLDAVTGCAVHSSLDAGQTYLITDLNLKICKAIPPQIKLFAQASVINKGRSFVLTEAFLRHDDGTLYAYATATSMIIRSQKSAV